MNKAFLFSEYLALSSFCLRITLWLLLFTFFPPGLGLKPWPCTSLASLPIPTPAHFVPSLRHFQVSSFTVLTAWVQFRNSSL